MYETSPFFYGTGRRKKSVARVRLYPGTGAITINGKSIDEYFGLETLKLIVTYEADKPGYFRKSLKVYGNMKESPMKLFVKGETN